MHVKCLANSSHFVKYPHQIHIIQIFFYKFLKFWSEKTWSNVVILVFFFQMSDETAALPQTFINIIIIIIISEETWKT